MNVEITKKEIQDIIADLQSGNLTTEVIEADDSERELLIFRDAQGQLKYIDDSEQMNSFMIVDNVTPTEVSGRLVSIFEHDLYAVVDEICESL